MLVVETTSFTDKTTGFVPFTRLVISPLACGVVSRPGTNRVGAQMLFVISRDRRPHRDTLDLQRPVPVLSVLDHQLLRGSWDGPAEFVRLGARSRSSSSGRLSHIRGTATWFITMSRSSWRRRGVPGQRERRWPVTRFPS